MEKMGNCSIQNSCLFVNFTSRRLASTAVKEGPAMTITPFLALKIRTKKDAVRARTRARRVAGLLSFDPHEQTCIAAGAFVIACQAMMLFGKARLCFQIESHQLQIFAEELCGDSG